MIPIKTALVRLVLLTLLLPGSGALRAEVKLPAIFGDHMVLQQGLKLPVWGTAAPGETVTVAVGTETAKATADANGHWRVDLPPIAGASAPLTMTVTGTNKLTFSDVLIGDVWVCSGQSNMGFSLGGGMTFGGVNDSATVVAAANDPQLRLFEVAKADAIDPQSDTKGSWVLCTPETAAPFSAVGYLFGHELRQALNRPIGLIQSAYGGTPAQAWTSLSGLEKEPALQPYVDEVNRHKANFAQASADYPAKMAAYQQKVAAFRQSDAAKADAKILRAWQQAVAAAKAAGQNPPPRPAPGHRPPMPPPTPDGGPRAPTVLFNAMIAPVIPYAIKGVAWYQGENNHTEGKDYRTIFGNMIRDWREKWGEGDFPFVYVQLANFKGNGPIQNWPYVRESQLKTLALPNTGMAVAVDVGNPENIHPTDKQDVAHRLVLAARHVAYGQNLVYSGPIYDAMQVTGNAIRVTFTQPGGGLIVGSAPWVPPGQQPVPTDKLAGFEIAGADKHFVAADAKIDGNAVVVSSPSVPAPVAVRYDWANTPRGNLYNKEMLPASPFRTDEWDDPAAAGKIEAEPATE
jgi:sialate O-acetylesterase